MKISRIIMLTTAMSLIVFGCQDRVSVNIRPDLSADMKQSIAISANQFNALLRNPSTIAFVKTGGDNDAARKVFMQGFVSSLSDQEQGSANNIMAHLFPAAKASGFKSKGEDDFFSLSDPAKLLTQKLTDDLKNTINQAGDSDQTTDQLSLALLTVIQNFKQTVRTNLSLSQDDVTALLTFAEFQSNTMEDLVNFAIAISPPDLAGGRTKGWFKTLIKVVVVVVVTAAVCAVVAASAGAVAVVLATAAGVAVSSAAAGAIIGGAAIAGAVYGGLVGGSKALDHNQCPTDLNLNSPKSAFLNWNTCP